MLTNFSACSVASGEKKRLNALGTPRQTAEISIIEL